MTNFYNIPPTTELKDKIILVTGSTDGIGEATAIRLTRMGAKVIIHGRTEIKALETVAKYARQVGKGELDWVGGDFTSFDEVKRMADEINSRYSKIDVLINNAGVYMHEKVITPDGFETTFQVNHLSHFLLTNLLLDLLKNGAPSRIIIISSVAHMRAKLNFKNLIGEKSFDPYSQYAVSKLANILFTMELSKNLEGTGITVNSLHPGIVRTKLLSQGFLLSGSRVQTGAVLPVYFASSPIVETISGKYFSKYYNEPAQPSDDALNEKYQKKMWDLSFKLVGLKAPKKTRKKKEE